MREVASTSSTGGPRVRALSRRVVSGAARSLAGVGPLSVLLALTVLLSLVGPASSTERGGVPEVRPLALVTTLPADVGGGPGGSGGGHDPAPHPPKPSGSSDSSGGSAAPKVDKSPSASAGSGSKAAPKPDATPKADTGAPAAQKSPSAAQNSGAAPPDTAPHPTPPGQPPAAAHPTSAAPAAVPPDKAAPGVRPPTPAGMPPPIQPAGAPPRPGPGAPTAAGQACAPGPNCPAAGPAPPGTLPTAASATDAQQQLFCATPGNTCAKPKPGPADGSADLTGAAAPISWKDAGHAALDGAVPVVQEAANGINAIWYAADGDWVNAGISAAGLIPGVGTAKLAAKSAGWFKKGVELVKGLRTGSREVAPAEDLAKTGGEVVQAARPGPAPAAEPPPAPAAAETPPAPPGGAAPQPPPGTASPLGAGQPGQKPWRGKTMFILLATTSTSQQG